MSLTFDFGSSASSSNSDYKNDIGKAYDQFLKTIEREDIGFFKLPLTNNYLSKSKELHEKFKSKTKFFHVGIGGSSLGPEMLTSALAKSSTEFFYLNNIDPQQIDEILENVTKDDSLFYFVSKSGGTAETMACFAIISNRLKSKFGVTENQLKDYFVFCTDPENGDLKKLGDKFSISCLEVPPNVGGRFSVLTPVGFFPALFAGIDIDDLLSGAKKMADHIKLGNADNNLLNLANYLFQNYRDRGITQTVLMPYSSKLRNFSFWFTQLWAESLGKKLDTNGEVKKLGFTPIPAYGATDQHSQVQLFMEGPVDKFLIILGVKNFETDFPLASEFEETSLKKLSPYSLSQLMEAELRGTLKALTEAERPHTFIQLDRNDAKAIGALVIFFESLTVLVGHLINVDPFDQPGVEAGKRYAYEWLEKSTK